MYTAAGQPDREQLVQRFAPLVKRVAYHLMARLPANVQFDDLVQNGMLGLLDAEKITLRTGDMRILEAFALNCGHMLIQLPTDLGDNADDCMARLAATAREFGDLCTEVSADLADGSISDNELARIDRECGELMASLRPLREALARRNQQGKPTTEARP